jgi:hypothetical protein
MRISTVFFFRNRKIENRIQIEYRIVPSMLLLLLLFFAVGMISRVLRGLTELPMSKESIVAKRNRI